MLTTAGVREQGYEIDDDRGTITTPGKFEGEPWFVVALWEAALDGRADRDIVTDDDAVLSWFKVDAKLIPFLDLDAFPNLGDFPEGSWIGLWEDSNGFVHHDARTECKCTTIGECPICDAEPEGNA